MSQVPQHTPCCLVFQAQLQEALDSRQDPGGLESPHCHSCQACQQQLLAAHLLYASLESMNAVPEDVLSASRRKLLDLPVLVRSTRRRAATYSRRLIQGAVAASILFLSFWIWKEFGDYKENNSSPKVVASSTIKQQPPATNPSPWPDLPQLDRTLSQVSDSARKTALAPPETIWFGQEKLAQQPVTSQESILTRLPDVTEMARTGFEPVSRSTIKAFRVIIRDAGWVTTSIDAE